MEKFCDTVGKDENGDDLLTLKSRFTRQAERTETTSETAVSPSRSIISGSAFPNRTSPSFEPAPQDLI
jgi:hypothetical protein